LRTHDINFIKNIEEEKTKFVVHERGTNEMKKNEPISNSEPKFLKCTYISNKSGRNTLLVYICIGVNWGAGDCVFNWTL